MGVIEIESRARSMLIGLGVLTGLAIAAAMVGWLATSGNPLFVVAPVVVLVSIFMVLQPSLLFWSSVFGGLVVAGVTRLYLPPLEQIRWLLAPLTLLLLAHVVLRNLGRREPAASSRVSPILWWALAFIGVAVFSSVIDGFQADRFIVGFKGYFQVWPLLFAMALASGYVILMERLPKALLIIALMQIPFVLHQLLILVPARVGLAKDIVPIDVVAGTFGASMDGGGANAIMNAFLMMVLAGLVAARQLGLISWSRLLGLGALLLAPLLVNEAKVSVFYLLAAFVVLFAGDMRRRPLRFLASGAVVSLLLAAFMVAFTLNSPSHERIDNWRDLVAYTYEYNVERDELAGKLSRFGALQLWAENHGMDNWRELLIGHGIGYTRVADARAFPVETVTYLHRGIPIQVDLEKDIGNTAVTALLWETGLIGLFTVFALLAVTFRVAGRLEAVHADTPSRVVALRAARVGMVILFITLWHKNALVFDVVYQTLVMLLIGYVAYWDRQGTPAPRTSSDEAPRRGSSGRHIPVLVG